MCGIGGVASLARPSYPSDAVARALSGRGPEGAGHQSGGGDGWSWELVHTRLSIVDLSEAGREPICNEDGSLWMSFNGEIYNYPELKRFCVEKGHAFSSAMDGEVILHLWEMEGPGCLARLNGMFAVAVVDTHARSLYLARDPLGVKPLFYSTDASTVWFGSEVRTLHAAGAPVGSVDHIALARFLSFLWIPDPATPYTGIRTVEPGTVLEWNDGSARSRTYGEPLVPVPQSYGARPGLVDEAANRIQEACTRQLQADVPIGLMASGGVDSALIWWATKGRLERAFSIAWDEPDVERLSDDRIAVEELQNEYATPVDFIPGSQAEAKMLPTTGDLFADPAYELTREIARVARGRGLKVLLSGQGGDELFGGYRRHSVARRIGKISFGAPAGALAKLLRRGGSLNAEYASRVALAFAERDPFDGYMQLCTYSDAAERAMILDCTEAEVSHRIMWERHRQVYDELPDDVSLVRKAMALDLRVYLPGLGLSYVDRAGMEYGVEIRVPWLDLELVRWSLSLPDDALFKRGRGKWLPRAVAEKHQSRWLAHRPKRAFAAPVGRVATGADRLGTRGFRQGAYLARAAGIVEAFLATGSVDDEEPIAPI